MENGCVSNQTAYRDQEKDKGPGTKKAYPTWRYQDGN